MTIALDTPTPTFSPRSRWIRLAPVTVLMAGMFGFTWVQITADADRSIAAQAVASQDVPPVSAAPQSTSAGDTPASVAAPAEDRVPSLEDQELASYATCGA